MMPAEKFRDGSIKVSMLSYALSEDITRHFDFSWDKGIYREMVRRAIRRATFPSKSMEGFKAFFLIFSDIIFRGVAFLSAIVKNALYSSTTQYITDNCVRMELHS